MNLNNFLYLYYNPINLGW